MEGISFRMAEKADADGILGLICELAAYENAADEVRATPDILREWIFDRNAAEVLLAVHEADGIVGMAVFFQNFSTWTGKGGMYLEDLVVTREYRGQGVGRAIMARLAGICRNRGWVRLDWACLDWNEPSLGFYAGLGASRVPDFIPIRLTGDSLDALAEEGLRAGASDVFADSPAAGDAKGPGAEGAR